jgi:alpha-glucosidase
MQTWWRGAVIYQIYPRSFADSNHDGVGDLRGITERLPYIAQLGVDAIWISPFFKSPMKDFGYDVSDYCAVDPLFGSLDDFKQLLKTAHDLGLKVVIDQVLSHSSDQHAWFVDSRSSKSAAKADWYVWADAKADGTPPNNWLSVFGGSAWSWDTRRCQYYFHNFLASQPDLNFHTPAVQDALLSDIRFWLELGVDGFRFDACNFHFHDRQLRNNPAALIRDSTTVAADNPYGFQTHQFDKSQPENFVFLQRLRRLLDEYGAVSVGEVGDDHSLPLMAAYTQDADKLHMAYSFNLLTKNFSAAYIKAQVSELEACIANGWGCWALGNHDAVRVMTRWGRGEASPELAKTLLAMLLCLRGSACLYQGEELGLTEADIPFELLQDPYGIAMWPEFKGRDGCRTPMPWRHDSPHAGFSVHKPWLPVPLEHYAAAADLQEADPQSVLNFYRGFIHWRKSHPALISGDMAFIDSPEPLLIFSRSTSDTCVLCVFNLADAPQTIQLPYQLESLLGHCLTGELREGRVQLDAYAGFIGRMLG